MTAGSSGLPNIESGFLRFYFIYDIADKIDLAKAAAASVRGLQRAQLELKPSAAPGYVQFAEPPLQGLVPELEVQGRMGSARVRIYDHGTITIRLSFPFNGSPPELLNLSRQLRQSSDLAEAAEKLFKKLTEEIAKSVSKPYDKAMTEDYLVLSVQKFAKQIGSKELLESHRAEIAGLLLRETQALSDDEQIETLRVHYSYYEKDLVVVHWDAALIFDDSELESEAAENILEFANVQLVQYLTYDARLDAELADIYRLNLVKGQGNWLFGKTQAEKRAEKLRYVLVDIREISDHASNALKMIGDAFYARLYRGAALRLGLPGWQEQIDHKMDSIQEIYQFIAHQSQYAQSAFMEIIIVILILVEVLIALLPMFGVAK